MSYSFEYKRKKNEAEWPAFINIDDWKHAEPGIYLIQERCKGCGFCIEFCPEQILEHSADINQKGYHPPQLKEGKTFADCAECHFCELICPEFAIYIKESEEKENKEQESKDEQ